jgi:hypothetical protein
MLRGWRLVTLVLTALSLTMESAHVLELPQKLRYDPAMYAAVNGSLYRWFAIVGGVYQVGAIVLAAILTGMVRGRGAAFGWTLAGTVTLGLAFVVWIVVVAPVNRIVADAAATAPETVPGLWTQLRWRWEGGHAAGFAVQVVGFVLLLVGVLVETPDRVTPRAAC